MSTSIPEQSIPNTASDMYSTGSSPTDGSNSIELLQSQVSIGFGGIFYAQGGFRFDPVPVPNGANIISASLTPTSYFNLVSASVQWKITAEDVDDPGVWTANHRPGTGGAPGRGPETTAKVDWDISVPWAINTPQQTPNLKDIVQELVNRVGWVSGQAMAFIIRSDGVSTTLRRVYDFHPTRRCKLNITYGPVGGQIIRINIT